VLRRSRHPGELRDGDLSAVARASVPFVDVTGDQQPYSVFDTLKGQLSLEHHGAITMSGLMTRISQRLLALAAGLWHNWNIGEPGRHLIGYDH